jgi:hypothetical protein
MAGMGEAVDAIGRKALATAETVERHERDLVQRIRGSNHIRPRDRACRDQAQTTG